jgi:predicted HAD superfamily Cof-like phosphohydrolase
MSTHDTVLRMVREYHEKLHPDQVDMTPATADADLIRFRRDLFTEEAAEALDEFTVAEWEAAEGMPVWKRTIAVARLMHELADAVIVAYGTAMRLGVDLDAVMHAVMLANMSKVANPPGKATKPPGWVPADTAVLALVTVANGTGE